MLLFAQVSLKNAPILLLDEATSSLDSQAELEVQEALQSLTAGRTTLVIAHRLSTVIAADKIYVLENGQVTESGDHKTLIKRDGSYSRFHNLQFAKVKTMDDSQAGVAEQPRS